MSSSGASMDTDLWSSSGSGARSRKRSSSLSADDFDGILGQSKWIFINNRVNISEYAIIDMFNVLT